MVTVTHLFNLMTPHLRTNSHFSVLFSSMQKDEAMSKRNAELITESAAAKQRVVRNLSAFVKVEKDNKADYVVGVEHTFQTIMAGNNHQRPKKRASKLSCDHGRVNPCKYRRGWTPCDSKARFKCNSQKRVHNVRSHDDLPATNEAEEALNEEVSVEVNLKFGKVRNQILAFPSSVLSWTIVCGQCYTSWWGVGITPYLENSSST